MLGLVVETLIVGKGIVATIGLLEWLSCNWYFGVRSSPVTVIMVLVIGPKKHIPCLVIQVMTRIMLFSGSS